MAKDLSHSRYTLLELLVWWQGYVTNKQLVNGLNISRQQAYNDLKSYCKLYPHNLIKYQHGYKPSVNYRSNYISDDVNQFLAWLTTGNVISIERPSQFVFNVELPKRKTSVHVVRGLVRAISEQKRVEAAYVSLSHPEYDGRIFHPHTFINTGHRWHVRGYCEKAQGFRDLVLSRFQDEIELLDGPAKQVKDDVAWNKSIKILLKPDPRLSVQQQNVVTNDYKLKDGLLIVETKAALASYLLHEMKVNTKMLDGTPEAQQWVLVNQDDVKQWLF